jgi:hypothetical protein
MDYKILVVLLCSLVLQIVAVYTPVWNVKNVCDGVTNASFDFNTGLWKGCVNYRGTEECYNEPEWIQKKKNYMKAVQTFSILGIIATGVIVYFLYMGNKKYATYSTYSAFLLCLLTIILFSINFFKIDDQVYQIGYSFLLYVVGTVLLL